jgi:hypothetical protein
MSYDFNAGSRYAKATFSGTYAVPISMCAWIKLSAANWAGTSQKFIATLSEAEDVSSNAIILDHTDGLADRAGAKTRDATSSDSAQNTQATPGEYDDTWCLVVGVFASTSSRTHYFNSSSDKVTDTNTTDSGTSLKYIKLGSSGGGFSNLDGLGAEFCFWDKALSDAEVNQLVTASETGKNPSTVANANCLAYYPLNVSSGTHVDSSGNGGPTLTITNAVYDADHPTITGGVTAHQSHNYQGMNRLNGGFRS